MILLEFLLGKDSAEAKKLFDEAHADLIDTINAAAHKGKVNGHRIMAHATQRSITTDTSNTLHTDSGRIPGYKRHN